MLRLRALALAVVAACAFGVGACGGDPSYGDPVPASTPELTPPAGADALADESATSTDERHHDLHGHHGHDAAPRHPPAAPRPAARGRPRRRRPSAGAGTGGASGHDHPGASGRHRRNLAGRVQPVLPGQPGSLSRELTPGQAPVERRVVVVRGRVGSVTSVAE